MILQMSTFPSHKFSAMFEESGDADDDVEFEVPLKDSIATISRDHKGKLRVDQESVQSRKIHGRMVHATENCSKYKSHANFEKCVLHTAHGDLEGLGTDADAVKSSMEMMESRLRNYTCSDPNLETSPPLYSKKFTITSGSNSLTHTVDVLLDTSHAKIWLVDNFVTPDQCEAMRVSAEPNLMKAAVASGDGSSVLSEARKAQQARYRMNTTDDPLYDVYQKIFSVTNTIAGYDLNSEGQEPLMVIQYNKDDQYRPHCDGNCDGAKHQKGGRVATAVIYCETAIVGGGTTFTKADLFVKPRSGTATFFSYKGADGRMDEGLTKHSGCPVLEGEKWITTAWMREGVTKEIDESYYDPSGMLLKYT